MIALQFKIEGEDKLKKQFSALGDRVQKKILIRSLKKCSKPLEQRMKDLASVSRTGGVSKQYPSRNHPPGYLRASVGTIVGRGNEFPAVWVRPRFRGAWDPWYEHFPMAGTKHMTISPNPFVDKAWDEMGAITQAMLQSDLIQNIQDEINRI